MEESIAESVLAANDAFYRAFNQKDVEAMEMIWSHRPDVSCVHPGWNVLRGEEVMGSWHAILGNPEQPRIVTGAAGVSLIDDVAIVVCRELVAGGRLAATNVFVLEEGDWRLLHHQSGPVAQEAP